jgi:putative ABC transport system permease protein
MRSRSLGAVERLARTALRMSHPDVAPVRHDEIVATIRHACQDAAGRGGWPAFGAAAASELLDLVSLPLRRRLGRGPRVTDAAPMGPRPPRGPLMVAHDVRRAWKRLRRGHGGFLLAVAMLALAIGITTAMFTVVDALMLRPVPFRDPAALTAVVSSVQGGRGFLPAGSPALLRAWKASGAFSAVEGAIQWPVVLDGGQGLVSYSGARISPGMLSMLGVDPVRGRGFTSGEGRKGTDDRILISEEVWDRIYGRDPGILGKRVQVSGAPMEVVGVMPADFRFPYSRTQVWLPADFDSPASGYEKSRVQIYGRIAPGIPAADALTRADAAALAAGAMPRDRQTMFRPVAAGMVDAYSRRAVTALGVGVGLVFLVLCFNAMNLMLTRFSARQREFGVLSALGASRARLFREALAETMLMGVAGSAAAWLLAHALVALAVRYLPDVFLSNTLAPIEVSTRALAATSILGVGAIAIAGIAPAWLATRVDAAESLRVVVRGSEVKSRRRLSRALLVGEVALATALLAGAALLTRTFVNLLNADRGLNADGVVTAWVSLPEFSFKERAGRLAFARALEERMRQLPGVTQVTLSNGVPPGAGIIFFGEVRVHDPAPREIELDELNIYNVSPRFFELFGIPLRAGAIFSEPASGDEVIIGERLARTLWPDGNAVGRTFTVGSGKLVHRVIGVVAEIRTPSLDPRVDTPEMYRPLLVEREGSAEASALASGEIFVALRCDDACPSLPAVSDAVRSVSAQVLIPRLGFMDQAYLKELARPRAAAVLAVVFGGVAVLACAGGLFGVLSASVASRRREFGIRVALGIEPSRLRRLVMADAARLAALGLAVGCLGGWMLGRSLSAVSYGVTPTDLPSWAAVCGALGAALLAGAWRPAAEATRVDPVALLREE